ncbi:hypothetical protein [Rhizobium leguminosarum]|uniref:hypothetical protein n=1 Tax=Rhizobium leguminosarum TaxID=384 RepID=UPI0013EE9F57|nr:hypothetical protein [Rhizobium leguminosarum]
MTEPETRTEAEVKDFTDELSDEALDRGNARWCFHTLCGNPTSVCDVDGPSDEEAIQVCSQRNPADLRG